VANLSENAKTIDARDETTDLQLVVRGDHRESVKNHVTLRPRAAGDPVQDPANDETEKRTAKKTRTVVLVLRTVAAEGGREATVLSRKRIESEGNRTLLLIMFVCLNRDYVVYQYDWLARSLR
jgi:hypothetical protein